MHLLKKVCRSVVHPEVSRRYIKIIVTNMQEHKFRPKPERQTPYDN